HYTYYFFLLLVRPPITPLFPYTTLFRSPSRGLGWNTAGFITKNPGRLQPGCRVPLTAKWSMVMRDFVGKGGCVRSVSMPSWTRRSEEHTSELQSRGHLVCRLLLEKKKKK